MGFWAVHLILGGSWVVISGVISLLIWVITIVTLLITPVITTHEPPSNTPKPPDVQARATRPLNDARNHLFPAHTLLDSW